MKKYFHECRETVNMCKREWTSVGSLNNMCANSLNQACETAIVGLWDIARNEQFPKEQFIPHHKPISYVKKLEILDYYSDDAKTFLEKLNGSSFDVVRYPETQPYKDYTNSKSKGKGSEFIKGTENFIDETEKLTTNNEVLEKIKSFKKS